MAGIEKQVKKAVKGSSGGKKKKSGGSPEKKVAKSAKKLLKKENTNGITQGRGIVASAFALPDEQLAGRGTSWRNAENSAWPKRPNACGAPACRWTRSHAAWAWTRLGSRP